MGCTSSAPVKAATVPTTPEDQSAQALLQQLKSKKQSEKEVIDDKSSSESEKRSASIETFTWEVYTYAEREESFRCIMSYYRSRLAFRAFFLGKSKFNGSNGALERSESMQPNTTNRDETLFAAWERASEACRLDYDNTMRRISAATNDLETTKSLFENMTIESVNLPSIPLVPKTKSGNALKTGGDEGSDKSVSTNLQSVYMFFKSPMYLTWRAEESACVGEITATNLSMKSFSFHESIKRRAAQGNERSSLAEMAFTLIHPQIVDLITNCSSWLGIFIAAAEGLPLALFLCECEADDTEAGYKLIYLNPPSAVLFHCDRREVIDNRLVIPPVPGLSTNGELEAENNLKSKIIVKLVSKGANGTPFHNYCCVKSIFDQSRKARFILGMHGDVDKLGSRRDVKMLEVLLGILPDNVTDDK